MALLLVGGLINPFTMKGQTQTDVTGTYISDADFSSSSGWTMTKEGTGNWTFNTSQKVAEAYGGWSKNTEITSYSLKQDVTLPKGTYMLTGYAFYRAEGAYDSDPTTSLAYIVAGDTKRLVKPLSAASNSSYPDNVSQASTAFYTDGNYLNTLFFVVDADNTTISIGYEGTHDTNKAKSWFIAGEMKLYQIDDVTPALADGTYFFKNDGGKYWMRGEPYGSAVQIYDWGLPVNVTTNAAGVSTLKFADASDWKIFSDGSGIYADNASPANGTWLIEEKDGKYIFQNAVNNHYIKVEGSRLLSTYTAGEAASFSSVTPASHQEVLTAYVNAQASAAATAAQLIAATPAALQAAVDGLNATSIISGSTPSSTAEKYQGGQWDSRTVYSGSVDITTPGLYKFTMQGYYRMTDNATTYALHTANADCPPVYVFFGDAKTPIKSVFDYSNTTNNNCYTAADGKYYPNGQTSALTAFQAGNYTNTVWAYIAQAGTYSYGIQYLNWAGSHAEWTCYTTQSISLTLYSRDLWDPLQSALTTYAPYSDVTDATGYTDQYNIFKKYTESTPQSEMQAAIDYMTAHYADYKWANASIAHPVDVTEGIISGWECTSNDAWPGGGRTTATGTYYDGTNRTYFTQNHEDGAARTQSVTIPKVGAYLLRTIVRPVADASYATISIGDESTTTKGKQIGAANIGNGWAYNDIYFATTAANASKTISINLSNVNNSREADCGEMHLLYIGQSADFVKDGVHRYIGDFATAPTIELTDAVPVADLTDATFSGTSSVTFTNPNGLVFANAASQVKSTTNVVVNGTCATLALADGYPFVNPTAFTATNASYTLSALAGGSFATLMLPFAATAPGGNVYALNQGVNLIDGNLYGTASTIEANSPVLVTAAGDYTGSSVTVPVVARGATYTNGELVGTYSDIDAPVNSYVLQNHSERVAFYLVGSTQPTVNPFRAYIKSQASNVKAISVMFDEDSIQTMDNGQWTMDNAEIFNLSGQRLSKPQRGVNIINGKKVVVK